MPETGARGKHASDANVTESLFMRLTYEERQLVAERSKSIIERRKLKLNGKAPTDLKTERQVNARLKEWSDLVAVAWSHLCF